MTFYLELLCGLVALAVATYYYLTSTYEFWTERGIPGPKPVLFYGNTKDVAREKLSMGCYLKKIYDEYQNEPMVGLFARRSPVLLLNDPDLIKNVLIKDFSMVADRGMPVFEKTEPLSQHLFSLEPERWRPLRLRLSPIFTSGKLKEMFSIILKCSDDLEKYLDTLVAKGEPIECRDLTSKFTVDVIGNCAFGIEANSLVDGETEFTRMAKMIFNLDFIRHMKILIRQLAPPVYTLLGYIFPETEMTKFFTKIIIDTMEYRKKNNIYRPDFVNALLDLQKNPEKLENIKLTDSFFAAQAFVFFIAGFETSSSTISNALYELALNPKVQDKLREEIAQSYAKNKDLTYNSIKDMPYLDKVFQETLRKYPVVTFLMRKTATEYTFEGTKVTIPKNTRIWISNFGIHRNPNIYPNPEVFDPERFNEDAVAARHPMYYLPFGDGPRNCIGARFALYQTKLGIIKILRNHRVEVCEKTQIPLKIKPTFFMMTPEDGIHLKIVKTES